MHPLHKALHKAQGTLWKRKSWRMGWGAASEVLCRLCSGHGRTAMLTNSQPTAVVTGTRSRRPASGHNIEQVSAPAQSSRYGAAPDRSFCSGLLCDLGSFVLSREFQGYFTWFCV